MTWSILKDFWEWREWFLFKFQVFVVLRGALQRHVLHMKTFLKDTYFFSQYNQQKSKNCFLNRKFWGQNHRSKLVAGFPLVSNYATMSYSKISCASSDCAPIGRSWIVDKKSTAKRASLAVQIQRHKIEKGLRTAKATVSKLAGSTSRRPHFEQKK